MPKFGAHILFAEQTKQLLRPVLTRRAVRPGPQHLKPLRKISISHLSMRR